MRRQMRQGQHEEQRQEAKTRGEQRKEQRQAQVQGQLSALLGESRSRDNDDVCHFDSCKSNTKQGSMLRRKAGEVEGGGDNLNNLIAIQ